MAGFYGLNYRTLRGLHLSSRSDVVADANGPLWDVYVGGLPFLLWVDDTHPYLRESTSARRDRVDSARDPGDVSLDSAIWIRSQTSWHLGAGQSVAEPLEGDAEEARFRYAAGGGVNPWAKGQVSMINTSLLRGTGARRCLYAPGYGVVVPSTTGVLLYPTSGAATSLSTKTTVTGPVAVSGTRWFGASSTGIEYGNLATGGEGQVALTGITALSWAKDRLWAGAGASLYELPAFPTLPAAVHTFTTGGSIVDIEAGAASIYVMVNGPKTSIFAISVDNTGALSAPREVATLPRGETGITLYGYLGGMLAIGTSKGLRIADCSNESTLTVGPLVLEATGGVYDMVGDGSFLYVTAGTERVSPDGTNLRPGLYRVDLSSPIADRGYGQSVASLFPYAADLYEPGSGSLTGRAWSVTVFQDRIWYVAGSDPANASVYRRDDALSTTGWVDSGPISFSTAERKAWLSMYLEATGGGTLFVEGDAGGGRLPVSQTVLSVPRSETLALDATSLGASAALAHRVYLTGDGTTSGSPTLKSVSLRATPVPQRTRYIRLPLACFDQQRDRNNTPVGYTGFAWDRLLDLENLEEHGALVSVVDRRTGETVRALIDRVAFEGQAAPSRGFTGFGGVVNLTLLVV